MISIFLKGGPVMWPILAVSLVVITIILERLLFVLREMRCRDVKTVKAMFTAIEQGDIPLAYEAGSHSKDYVAHVLTYALEQRDVSFSNAILTSAGTELQRYNRGITMLDTAITLAPLLGLFGTVTGMIHAFGLLGASELGAPTAISGGIAEALIATAFGLLVAMVALLPFNYLNSMLERARHEIETAAAHLEILLLRHEKESVLQATQLVDA